MIFPWTCMKLSQYIIHFFVSMYIHKNISHTHVVYPTHTNTDKNMTNQQRLSWIFRDRIVFVLVERVIYAQDESFYIYMCVFPTLSHIVIVVQCSWWYVVQILFSIELLLNLYWPERFFLKAVILCVFCLKFVLKNGRKRRFW